MKNLYKIIKSFFSSSIFILAILLSDCSSSSSIKLSELHDPKKTVRVEEDIVTPYDSSYLHMKVYPSLNYYKKYIEQQLYLPPLIKDQQSFRLFTDKGVKKPYKDIYKPNWVWHYVWHPDLDNIKTVYEVVNSDDYLRKKDFLLPGLNASNGEMEIYSNDESFVCNRYYTITNVLSVVSDIYDKHHPEPYDRYYFSGIGRHVEMKEKPYFVLKEKKTGNIVYTTLSDEFILVNGFEKIQKKLKPLIGNNIYRLNRYLSNNNTKDNNNDIKYIEKEEILKCIDIVLNSRGGHSINLVLKNDKGNIQEIKYTELILEQGDNGGQYITESLYNEMKNKETNSKQKKGSI